MGCKPFPLLIGLTVGFFIVGECQDEFTFPTQPGGLFLKKSNYGAVQTIDRLENSLRFRNFRIIARISHHRNAALVNMTLRPTELLIFGNPEIGTRLMQTGQSIGIDLPMKALAYEDENRDTWLIYNEPVYITWRHAINDKRKFLQKMTQVLDSFTEEAVRNIFST